MNWKHVINTAVTAVLSIAITAGFISKDVVGKAEAPAAVVAPATTE